MEASVEEEDWGLDERVSIRGEMYHRNDEGIDTIESSLYENHLYDGESDDEMSAFRYSRGYQQILEQEDVDMDFGIGTIEYLEDWSISTPETHPEASNDPSHRLPQPPSRTTASPIPFCSICDLSGLELGDHPPSNNPSVCSYCGREIALSEQTHSNIPAVNTRDPAPEGHAMSSAPEDNLPSRKEYLDTLKRQSLPAPRAEEEDRICMICIRPMDFGGSNFDGEDRPVLLHGQPVSEKQHTFCLSCAKTWFEQSNGSNTCPMCRVEVFPREDEDEDEDEDDDEDVDLDLPESEWIAYLRQRNREDRMYLEERRLQRQEEDDMFEQDMATLQISAESLAMERFHEPGNEESWIRILDLIDSLGHRVRIGLMDVSEAQGRLRGAFADGAAPPMSGVGEVLRDLDTEERRGVDGDDRETESGLRG